MPEGDTIHKVAAVIAPDLVGCTLAGGRLATHPDILLAGRRVTNVHALGKHLFIEFADGLLLRSHLGMYGSWHRYRPGEPWRKPERSASVVLDTGDWLLVCFYAFAVELLQVGGFGARDWSQRLGPDLLDPDVRISAVAERAHSLSNPDTLLVDLLLAQRVAAGIGNVYKSELLFIERLPPTRRLRETSHEQLCALYQTAQQLLHANLERGRRRTRFVDDGRGDLWVYKREGRPCLACGTRITSRLMGRRLRPTFWCPVCQKAFANGMV